MPSNQPSNESDAVVGEVFTPSSELIVEELLQTTVELSASLRERVTRACQTISTGGDAHDVIRVMRSAIDAHLSTCLYTADKVAIGIIKYEADIASKPQVSHRQRQLTIGCTDKVCGPII